ncbi:MAG: beta strand repeat-containing protein [Candidatus Nanopelagicales bacterium]
MIQNQIAAAVFKALPGSGPADMVGGCTGSTPGSCPASVANTIAAYTFNIVYSLMGGLGNETVGASVAALVQQPTVLTFISQTVAGNPALAILPSDVKTTIGNAAATFLLNSLGNAVVATQFAPALQALNLPTGAVQATLFTTAIKNQGLNAAILASGNRQFSATGMQTALVKFFTNSTVQSTMGSAFAGSINVLLGQATPMWDGAPQTSNTALADYLGQLGANTVLGQDNPNTPALSATIGNATAVLFSSIGGVVATQAGSAFTTLLQQPTVATSLANYTTNGFWNYLNGPDSTAPLPFPAQPLLPALAPAAGVAVTGFVNSILSTPAVPVALGAFVNTLIPGMLANPGVDQLLGTQAATAVANLLGNDALAQAVGARVGTAVASLVATPSVSIALTALVNSLFGSILAAPGAVTALANAAGQLTTADLDGTLETVRPVVEAELRTNAAIDGAVQSAVTSGVAALFGNAEVVAEVNAATVSLVTGLLGDSQVQQALGARVTSEVAKLFGDTELGQAVGAQAGIAVVNLLSNPSISAGLVGLVDTVFGDFFGAPGVVTAFSTAAGELAAAGLAGNLDTVLPQVQAQLMANPAIQTAVRLSVGDAVTTLLTDPNVVSALDTTASSLVAGLLGDPAVQTGLDAAVTKEVSTLLGGGLLGQAVGAQVGTAVVEILSNPIVKDALEASLDNQLGDFFSAPGVVNAFATAADTFALGVVTGEKITTALSAAEAQLRSSAAIDNAVGGIVTASVADLLGNSNVWSAVDGTASRLVADLLASTEVQQAAYTEISTAFGNSALGQAVGDKVAAAVVDLMQDPDVSVALVGLVDTTTQDFFGYPGVVTAFADAAGELASAAVAGTLATVAPQVQAELRANAAVEQATGLAVGDAVTTLLTDDTVLAALDQKAASVVTELLTDPAVQTKLNALIVAEVSKLVGGGALGQAVGTQVATAVATFLGNPSVQVALVGLVDDELGNFFRAPGVVDAFAEAANTFALEVVTGEDVKTAANQAVAWLRADAAVDDAVVGIVTESVGALLSNANVIQAADSGLATLLTNLGPDAGQLVTVFVTKSLGASPIAVPVGQALGAAVQQLLTVPGFGAGVVTIITSALPEFLGQFGVPTALAGIAGDYLAALVAGEDPKVAEQNAVTALRTNPTIDSAAKTTIADSLTLVDLDLLSSPAIQQALGATVTTLITTLAADPAIQAFVAQQDGPALAELLTDTAAVADLATGLGSVVTQLLAYPGFNTALLGAVNQFADDVIDGAAVTVAEQSALKGLRSAPAVVAAVGAVIPPAVNTLLSYSDVRQALGVVAQEDIIAALQKVGINNRFLDRTIGQVTDGTVESLLVRPAGVNLVDDLVVNILLGMPLSDWRGFTIQEVIDKPQLQIALGMSLGKGIGSLFGDNVIGDLVGLAAGVPATLAIGLTSLTVALFQLIFGRPAYGVSPSAAAGQALPSESHYFQAAPAAADLYVIRIGGLVGA